MLLRSILFAHRWLGVAIGALMTLWCLSGFVMMYSEYPRLSPDERLRGLASIVLPSVSKLARIPVPPAARISSVAVETVAGRVVVRIIPAKGAPAVYDFATGTAVRILDRTGARAVGTDFAWRFGIEGPITSALATSIDQWTLQDFRGNEPVYRIEYADPAGSTIYIAGNSGTVIQQTTRTERIAAWFGAIPHWLYPTVLRQNGRLWSQVVIWTSLAGCFLTVTGLWLGIARLRRGAGWRPASPYVALRWWHHVFGVIFGLLALAWVGSGLISMNPWGVLESRAGEAEAQRLSGIVRWSEARDALSSIAFPPGRIVRVETAPLGGRLFLVEVMRDGSGVRVDHAGKVAPLTAADLHAALQTGPPLTSFELIHNEDDYYYAHRSSIRLPVWRAILADADATRLYIDPTSGQLVGAIDRNARRFRWWQNGLHSLDLPGLRKRPWWDAIVLPLLAAVTVICATGTWLGVKRLRRDWRRWRLRYRAES